MKTDYVKNGKKMVKCSTHIGMDLVLVLCKHPQSTRRTAKDRGRTFCHNTLRT